MIIQKLLFGSALLPLASLANPVTAQSVHVVDASGAVGGFTSIQLAIDSANDGDLVLVLPGTYGGFAIDGKGLTLVADGPGVIVSEPGFSGVAGLDIRNLPTGSSVNAAGLTVEAGTHTECSNALQFQDCLGPIQIRDFSVSAGLSIFGSFESNTNICEVNDCAAVSIVDSDFDATTALAYLYECGELKAHALLSKQSNVFVHGSSLASGEGYWGDGLRPPSHGGNGHGAWTLIGGFGLGIRTTAFGGTGGLGNQSQLPSCGNGGNGGPGLALLPSSGPAPTNPTFVRSSMLMIPGGPGMPSSLPCTVGMPGEDVTGIAGNVLSDDFAARALQSDNLIRFGATKSATFIGEPLDLVWHIFSATPATPTFVPELTGAPTVGGSFIVRFRGAIPASGQKTVNATVPDLGVEFVTVYEEAYFFDGTRFYLSNPQFSVLLNDAF